MKFKVILLIITVSIFGCKMKQYKSANESDFEEEYPDKSSVVDDDHNAGKSIEFDSSSLNFMESFYKVPDFFCDKSSDDDYAESDDDEYNDNDISEHESEDKEDSDIYDCDLDGSADEDIPDNDVVFFPDEDVSDECRAQKAGIVLTFDDLLVSSWYKMHTDLFVAEGIKATFFLSRVYFLSEGSSSVDKLHEMIDYGHEMGCHTMHHKKLSDYLKEKTIDQYIEEEIEPSIDKAASLGISFNSFAYPFGNGNSEVDKRLFEYFDIIRYTGGILDKDNTRPYFIDRCRNILMSGAIDDPYDVDKDDITASLERAKEYDSIVIILAHEPTEEPPGSQSYFVTYDLLKHLIDEAKRLGMPFYTISEAFGKTLE